MSIINRQSCTLDSSTDRPEIVWNKASHSFCQTPRASANLELTFFYPCHNKNKKNPHQNLEESKLKVWSFAYGINLMEEDLQRKRTFDERQAMMEDGMAFDER